MQDKRLEYIMLFISSDVSEQAIPLLDIYILGKARWSYIKTFFTCGVSEVDQVVLKTVSSFISDTW